MFLHDVDAGLRAECAYVEQRLLIESGRSAHFAGQTGLRCIYEALLARDEEQAGVIADRSQPVARAGWKR